MSSLGELQREFFAAIASGEMGRAAPLVRGGALAPESRLEVYRRNVLATWRGALGSTHPVVERLVGEAFFTEAAHRYARDHPSTRGDLHAYGEHFGEFLAGYVPARELAYLPDVARLEWAWHACFHAPDAPAFDFAALAAVPAPRQGEIRLRLHPAARVIRSTYPILALWEANQPGRDGTPERFEGADDVLVQRAGLEVRLAKLESGEAAFLAACASGATLEAALGAIDSEARLGALLERHVASGVLSSFSLDA